MLSPDINQCKCWSVHLSADTLYQSSSEPFPCSLTLLRSESTLHKQDLSHTILKSLKTQNISHISPFLGCVSYTQTVLSLQLFFVKPDCVNPAAFCVLQLLERPGSVLGVLLESPGTGTRDHAVVFEGRLASFAHLGLEGFQVTSPCQGNTRAPMDSSCFSSLQVVTVEVTLW